MAQFGADLEITGDGAAYTLTGEVDAHTAPQLEQALDERIGADPSIVLDMSGVEFMDSSGVRVLIAATTRCREAQGDLVISRPSPMVQRLIDVSGLRDHLTVSDD